MANPLSNDELKDLLFDRLGFNEGIYGQRLTNIGGNTDTGLLENSFGRRYERSEKEERKFRREYLRELNRLNREGKDASDLVNQIKKDDKVQGANRDMHIISRASNITSFFAQLLHDAKDFYVALKNYEFNLYDMLIQNTSKLITQKINIGTQYYTNSLDVVTATLNNNIMEIGSQAASHQISLAKNIWEYQREYGLTLRRTQNEASIAEQNFVIGEQADFALAVIKNAGVTAINMINESKRYRDVKNGVISEGSDNGAKQGFNEMIKFVEQEKNEVKSLIDLRRKALELDVELQEKLFDYQKQLFERSEQIYQKVEGIAKITDNNLMSMDKSSKELAKQFGFVGAQGQAWTETMIDNNVIAAKKWAMKAEDFLHAQEAYFDTAARAVNLNQRNGEDFNSMAALSRATGVDMSQIGTLMGDMNIFNTSVGHGVDNIITMYRLANRMGLSGRKFIKDLSQNLKLAQKYNFVGGTKAMEKMSVWSQQVRLNLQTVANFAEGIMDGGLESTLEKAANLQVLGGNAAIYSDPLGMMYDAGADVANLARRVEGMLGNYGTFNAKTGETVFSWTDDMMVRQISKALGMDLEEAKDILREKNKFSVTRGQINRAIFNEEEQREISNRATYNDKTGQFEVTMLNGKKKSIADLTQADMDQIRSDNDTEALTQYAEKSLTVEQSIQSATEYIAAKVAQMTGDSWYLARKTQEEIIRANSNQTIEVGTAMSPKTWQFQNWSLAQDYSQMYKNYTEGTYDNALKQITAFTAMAANEVDNFGKELAQVNKLMENNDIEGLLKLIGAFAEETGSKNLIRVSDRATVNYGRSKDGKKHWDSNISGLMGGPLWGGPSDADMQQYGGRAARYVEPTKFTAAHGYKDERSWVVQESNTSAVNSLTKAINGLSSVQLKSNANVKFDGSIKLSGTNMKISADELAKDPEFMQQLASHLSRRIELNNNGGKSSGLQPGVVRT